MPGSHAARRSLPARALPVLSLAAVLTVSGCSFPGLPGPTGAPVPEVEQVAAVVPAPVQEEALPPRIVPNDLADGSASHSLTAAGNQLVVDYWTTDDAAHWTPTSSPIVRLSARVAGSAGDKAIKITRFNARVDALNTVLANDTGDFAIGAPHSYSSAVAVPAHPGADSTQIVFTFDLLTETAPGSGIFTRQTVMDALTIGYAGLPTNAPAAASTSK
jgi:hypothetical protein